jgi:hypothetical protein
VTVRAFICSSNLFFCNDNGLLHQKLSAQILELARDAFQLRAQLGDARSHLFKISTQRRAPILGLSIDECRPGVDGLQRWQRYLINLKGIWLE